MLKWGTYLIVGALVFMLLPFLLTYIRLDEVARSPILPFFSILLGGTGVIIHLFSIIKNNTISGQAIILLTAVLAIIFGIAFKSLGIENAKYLTLAGAILVALWLILPNKKKQ